MNKISELIRIFVFIILSIVFESCSSDSDFIQREIITKGNWSITAFATNDLEDISIFCLKSGFMFFDDSLLFLSLMPECCPSDTLDRKIAINYKFILKDNVSRMFFSSECSNFHGEFAIHMWHARNMLWLYLANHKFYLIAQMPFLKNSQAKRLNKIYQSPPNITADYLLHNRHYYPGFPYKEFMK